MASVKKFSASSEVLQILRHSSREIRHSSNPDIDETRSSQNYRLTSDRECSDYEYYKKRLSEVYVYNRGARNQETVTAAGWIVTLPEGDFTPDEERAFFEAVSTFLSQKFGGKNNRNVISEEVHYDEGKMAFRKTENGEPELDNEGHKIPEQFRVGRPHLHFNFVPCVEVDHERENAKRWHDPNIDAFEEKLCAAEVLNKRVLCGW